MNRGELIDIIKSLQGNSVKFAITDIDGILRGKMISKKFFKSLGGRYWFLQCNFWMGLQ